MTDYPRQATDSIKFPMAFCTELEQRTVLPRTVFIPIPKKGNAKECANYCTTALISHASKVMLKK